MAHRIASFRADLWRAFQRKGLVPEQLAEYQVAKIFWQNLGVRLAELDEWDEQALQEFLVVMDVESKYQTYLAKLEQAKQQAGGR